MAQIHSNHWYHVQNQLTGQPKSARHSDAWYAGHQPPTVGNAPAGGPGQNVGGGGNAGAPPVVVPPVVTPTGPTAEELAATAHAEAQARETAARDAWDRLNSQGAYDLDGWQSIGYQPDRVGMPAGWAANNWLPPTPPAAPAAANPLTAARTQSAVANPLTGAAGWVPNTAVGVAPTTNVRDGSPLTPIGSPTGTWVPNTATGVAPTTNVRDGSPITPIGLPPGLWSPGASNPGGATNALAALVGTGPAQAATAQPAQVSSVWGQGAFSAQQPDPGAWGQSSAGQTNRTSAAGTGTNQNQQAFGVPGVWGTKKKRTPPGQATLWGPQTNTGTWGTGTQ